ncbi:flagellar assembly protein FliH [Schlegelella sp. S2-27]|uniref:Flagellar assembly protein FliH n=1 Tax=Caldimonas mangrovi TaxID=2944811 RepID=A0ABT0YKV7_9BURK|nr:flagellar assembly protein FliH [Caldimonas mangrovi]MCM5679376.1 flagellar assembly protein FliH [Caldimonas mangrovi]
MTASSNKFASRTLYSRFIPREELHSFSAWNLGSLEDGESGPVQAEAPAPPVEPEPISEEQQAALQQARQAGYKDGYRDGLSALESFKQSYAAQITAQVGQVAQAFQAQLELMEQQLAGSLALVASELARQVVRSELQTQPALIEAVAQEALSTLLHSARHIRVHVHPDDHQLLAEQGQLDLESRQARLVPDASVSRGGCVVESDIGVIDAAIETRWRQAVSALGQNSEWTTGSEGSEEPA